MQIRDLLNDGKKENLDISKVVSSLSIDLEEIASFHGILALETNQSHTPLKTIENLAIALQTGIILGYYYALKQFSDTKTEKV